MNADPLNPEYQKLIAEEIRMENINENMETAMEHIPESFARVVMLYIDCQVNNTPVKAFVGMLNCVVLLICQTVEPSRQL